MLAYRFLTGPDDAAFCHRLTRELDQGWQLHGSPAMTFDAVAGRPICGQAIVKQIEGIDYDPALDLTTVGDLPFTIACFAERDRDAVSALIIAIQTEEFAIPITLDDQPDLLDIPGFYQQGAGDFWVARQGQKVIGTIGLREFAPGLAALRKMFVAQSHRGKTGVAAKLLATLLESARKNGLRQIILGTTAAFTAAQRFYEKHGFAWIDEGDLPAQFPRMAVDTVFYALELYP